MTGRQPVAGSTELSLRFAGFDVTVACDERTMLDALAMRYQGFLTQDAGAFTLRVIIDPSAGSGAGMHARQEYPPVTFQGESARLLAPGFEARLDVSRDAGWVRVRQASQVDEIDYCLRVLAALLVFRAGGFLFHAAGIARQGMAHVFFGHSGSGKTTVARLSRDALVLNDDLVVLLPGDAGWMVHATPFWNATQVAPAPASAPLAGLYRLMQDREVYLEPLTGASALAELVACIPVIPTDPEYNPQVLARAMQVLASVPAYRLHFLPEASFWNPILQETEIPDGRVRTESLQSDV